MKRGKHVYCEKPLASAKLEWDAANIRFTNSAEANQYVNPPYCDGWGLS